MSKPMAHHGPGGRPGPGGRKLDFRMLGRVIKLLFSFYPALVPVAIFCILFAVCKISKLQYTVKNASLLCRGKSFFCHKFWR